MTRELRSPPGAGLAAAIGLVLILIGVIWALSERSDNAVEGPRVDVKLPAHHEPPVSETRVLDLGTARQVISGTVTKIFQGLDAGNLQEIRFVVASQLLGNSHKLDLICKPFTHRAHYVESVIERPGGRYEARVRALFTPAVEAARVMVFRVQNGGLVLEDVTDPLQRSWYSREETDWFEADNQTGKEVVRKFLYALKAEKYEILRGLTTPTLATGPLLHPQCFEQIAALTEVRAEDSYTQDYKGLKVFVKARDHGGWFWGDWVFLLEKVDSQLRIVRIEPPSTKCQSVATIEDPLLESYTLKRFGLPVSAEP